MKNAKYHNSAPILPKTCATPPPVKMNPQLLPHTSRLDVLFSTQRIHSKPHNSQQSIRTIRHLLLRKAWFTLITYFASLSNLNGMNFYSWRRYNDRPLVLLSSSPKILIAWLSDKFFCVALPQLRSILRCKITQAGCPTFKYIQWMYGAPESAWVCPAQ